MSTAKTVAQNSEVARSDVYRIMESLEKLGLVEKIISVPCKFKATSIHNAFNILIERRKKVTSEVQAATREILKKIENNNARTSLEQDVTRFSLFSEQVTVLREKGMLDAVHESFDVVASWRNPHNVMFIDTEGMVKALRKGVKIRFIMDKPDEEGALSDIIERLKKYPSFKIRYLVNAPNALMSIYDKNEAWVHTCTHPAMEKCPTLRIENPCLLSILQNYFELIWFTALEFRPEQP